MFIYSIVPEGFCSYGGLILYVDKANKIIFLRNLWNGYYVNVLMYFVTLTCIYPSIYLSLMFLPVQCIYQHILWWTFNIDRTTSSLQVYTMYMQVSPDELQTNQIENKLYLKAK